MLFILTVLAMPVLSTFVEDEQDFVKAIERAKPGSTILVKGGEHKGGIHVSNVHGQPGRPITVRAANPAEPPVFVGGGSGLQLSDVSHLVIDGLVFRGARGNGLNIDDGGSLDTPSHHVTIRNVRVTDLPEGNHDGIKLSGLDDFLVEDCLVENWGGSAIDMVGCHRGRIVRCEFRSGGSSAVQCKGGTSETSIVRCLFKDFGQRGVNIGGSTGLEFFRPPVASMPPEGKYEAREVSVMGCTFLGGGAPVAFVGVDGARVTHNTIVRPGRWAVRILQETTQPGFVPSRKGVFAKNLIVFESSNWAAGGINIGGGTAPETFRFEGNFWWCLDRPGLSRPRLPSSEPGGVYGVDPLLEGLEGESPRVKDGSPAAGVGAHAYKEGQ